jgi:AbrB family looped-hinge helix DNA binding protein
MATPSIRSRVMSEVVVSPKYQVVIPREVRDALKLRPGQRVQVFAYRGRVEFVPVRSMRELRGSLRGISTDVEREADRS